MDLAPEELQHLSIKGILRESTSIPKYSPKTFCLVTLTLIFPLSFAILAHSLFTQPILAQLNGLSSSSSSTSATSPSSSPSLSSPPPPSSSPSPLSTLRSPFLSPQRSQLSPSS
ncbi:hypothetical protein Bca52824_088828 [Brassica carinata]|uniref:Uncharacterized protein n=2 Tax=Brassica TaxID=3705 RepID=A0A8S9SNI0_BRACR|nr:hypothetical protein F2Q69_00033557 [Brassica cretica]KAG2249200.1 hypothetical protein Bca52824_088828 [Brassica carinata]